MVWLFVLRLRGVILSPSFCTCSNLVFKNYKATPLSLKFWTWNSRLYSLDSCGFRWINYDSPGFRKMFAIFSSYIATPYNLNELNQGKRAWKVPICENSATSCGKPLDISLPNPKCEVYHNLKQIFREQCSRSRTKFHVLVTITKSDLLLWMTDVKLQNIGRLCIVWFCVYQ